MHVNSIFLIKKINNSLIYFFVKNGQPWPDDPFNLVPNELNLPHEKYFKKL